MRKTPPGLRTLILLGCIVSLTGCPILLMAPDSTPSTGTTTQTQSQKGTLELVIKWPLRQVQGFNTQAIPLSTNALVVWVRNGNNLVEKKTIKREPSNSTTTTKLTLQPNNNLAIETKAYRETEPNTDVNEAIARGTATANVLADNTTKIELTLDALFTPSINSLSSNFGMRGDTITLTGSGFGTTTTPVEVFFNQTKATEITRNSETGITAKVPEHATTGRVSVKVDGVDSISNTVYWVSTGIVISSPPKAILPKETLALDYNGDCYFTQGEDVARYGLPPFATWTSSDPSIIQINCLGILTALKTGSAEIQASVGSLKTPAVTVAVRQYVTSTVAGGGNSVDGAGLNCILQPYAMAEDSQGNIYVTEEECHRIRKIASNGDVTTFAGNGLAGNTDGVGTNASFNGPRGIAVDAADNVYVADHGNYCIRKITPQGVVSKFAGSGSYGWQDGIGTAATMEGPSAIAKDLTGNFIFTDGSSLRRFSTNGTVCTVNGSDAAGLNEARGLVMLSDGNIIVSDSNNSRLRIILPSGQVGTIITDDGMDTITYQGRVEPKLRSPEGMTLDANGDVIVADSYNHCLWKYDPSIHTFARCTDYDAGYQEGSLALSKFNSPQGLLLRADGSILVADKLNYRIRKIENNTTSPLYGSGSLNMMDGPAINARFKSPTELAFDPSGNLIILDKGNFYLRKLSTTGMVSTITGGMDTTIIPGGTGSAFKSPCGIAVNSAGSIFLTDSHFIKRIDGQGNVAKSSDGGFGYEDGQQSIARFWNPHGMTFDEYGNLYIADYQNSCIRKLDTAGMVATVAGKYYLPGKDDGQGQSATFYRPKDIAYTPTKLFVTDTYYQNIRIIDAQGNVTTLNPIFENAELKFSSLAGIAVDANENLYVLDLNRIWKINSSGVVIPLAGAGYSGAQDGPATSALFNQPEGITIDAEGNLYIADSGNNLIRKLTLQ